MTDIQMATVVKDRVERAARSLGTASPLPYVGELIERSFALPAGEGRYGANALTPGAVPFEPSFSEAEPDALRFTISPLGPDSSPGARRDEATREMRRLSHARFGRPALAWFDERSEDWRGLVGSTGLGYGAWLGTAYDRGGLSATKAYYELSAGQVGALPVPLRRAVQLVQQLVPDLEPVFMSLACRPGQGSQRVTFHHRDVLRLRDLQPLLRSIGLDHHLPAIMQVVGLALGGRFDIPAGASLIGIGTARDGVELKVEVLLGMIPDLPPQFLELLGMGLAERPRQLQALRRWLDAFTPEDVGTPGDFSVLSIRSTPSTHPRVSLYLRPVDFDVRQPEGGPAR